MAGPILRDGVNVRAPLYNEARHAVEALDRDRAKHATISARMRARLRCTAGLRNRLSLRR